MSSYEENFRSLQNQVAATPGKRVLVVEGSTDVDFLTWMFDKPPLKERNLHTRWVIGEAGGKSAVLRMLQKKPKWVGLVDRDAMGQEEIKAAVRKTPNLFLLPRYCIESYLIDPRLMDQLLQSPRYAQYGAGLMAARERIEAEYGEAIRHGSLWRAVQPLQDALQELGFNGTLLRFRLPDDEGVRRTLVSWSELMDWKRVYGLYLDAQREAGQLSVGKALSIWVHGKLFWRNIAGPILGEALGEDSVDRLARRLFRQMDLPGDVEGLMNRLTAYRAKG